MSEAISRIDLAAWHRACRCDPYATGTKLRRNRTICESYPGFRFAPSGLQSCQRVGWADLLRNPTPSARTDDGFRFRSTHPTRSSFLKFESYQAALSSLYVQV